MRMQSTFQRGRETDADMQERLWLGEVGETMTAIAVNACMVYTKKSIEAAAC